MRAPSRKKGSILSVVLLDSRENGPGSGRLITGSHAAGSLIGIADKSTLHEDSGTPGVSQDRKALVLVAPVSQLEIANHPALHPAREIAAPVADVEGLGTPDAGMVRGIEVNADEDGV